MAESVQVDRGEKRWVLAILLTALILIAQIIGGVLTGSLALLSDAAHVFLDMLALGMSYGALRIAALPANERHTYGFSRIKVLAALVNAVTLFIIVFEILREAVDRLQHPQAVLAGPMLIVAIVGLIVNLVVAFMLHDHDHDDLNTRGAFLHVLGDALSSVGVIGGGVVMLITGWYWIDPLISVFIALVLVGSSWRLLRETVHILIEGVPFGLDPSQVATSLTTVPGIQNVHDLHIWSIAPDRVMLSAHVVLADTTTRLIQQETLSMLKQRLEQQFGIQHTTIQFEYEDCGQGTPCLRHEPGELERNSHDA